jgi:hypothetical protein
LGGDVETRLNSIVAAELARSGETGQDPGSSFWDWAFSTWKQYVLQPRLNAAGQSCTAGRLALWTLLSFERTNELWGHPFTLLPNIPDLPQMPGSGVQSQGGQAGSNQSQDNGPTFLTQEWAVRNGELFAQKQWQTSVNMATSGTENGTFKLYHKPQ